MTQTPPPPAGIPYQSVVFDRDGEHLRILSICWYIASALVAVLGCIPLIYVFLGIMVISGSPAFRGGPGGPGGPPPEFMGWFFIIFGGTFVLLGWTSAILGFITARSLSQRRRLAVCYIAAAFACLQIPIGTTLAIFTFIVLGRPSIRASFS